MTATSIQALIGTNTCSLASNLLCAVDWTRNKVFVQGTPPSLGAGTLARLNLLDGTEEAFSLLSAYSSTAQNGIGVDGNGNVYLPGGSLYAGGIVQINGTTFSQMATGAYSTTFFGGSTMANVIAGSTQYIIDANSNGGVSGQIMVSHNATQDMHTTWPIAAGKVFVCAGQAGSNSGFMVHAPSSGGAQLNLYEVDCSGTPALSSSLGTVVPHDVDAAWSSIGCNGICIDETDGNILAVVYGQSAATQRSYVVKLDASNADVLWSVAVPGAGANSIAGGGYMMSQSRIRNEKFSLLVGSNFSADVTVLEVNTNTGTTTATYTAGLDGITPVSQTPQAFDDTLSAFVCNVSATGLGGADSPAPLNSTPASFSGWSVLYVGAPAPAAGTDDGWFDVIKPIRVS